MVVQIGLIEDVCLLYGRPPSPFSRFTISVFKGSQRIWFSQILRFVWGIGGYVVHISPSRWSQGAGLICALAEFLDLKEQFHQLI